MTKSTGCLPDVNVWLALASRAAKWMDGLSGRACFCRVTQAALLRLPTNWTDSYLLAFARAASHQLVTLDEALARRDPRAVLL